MVLDTALPANHLIPARGAGRCWATQYAFKSLAARYTITQSLGTPLGKGPVPRVGRSRRPVGAKAWVVVTARVTVPKRRERKFGQPAREVHHSK